jgi:hypothetical protein
VGVNRSALLIAGVIASTGCDKLFDLDHLAKGDGGAGAGDGRPVDGKVDAFVCSPVGHDEDADGHDDACDACPTFGPYATTDTDADGLPDQCDRNNAATMSDKIIGYWPFATDDLSAFTFTGSRFYDATNNGMFNISPDSKLTTMAAYALTRVDFYLSGITMADTNSQLQLQIGGQTICTLTGAQCNGTAGGTCVRLGTSTNASWPKPSSAARRVSLYNMGNLLKCELSDGADSAPATISSTLPTGSVGFATNSSASLVINAIVIYGAN